MVAEVGESAPAKIGFGDRSRDRLRSREQSSGGFRAAGLGLASCVRFPGIPLWLGDRQAEEAACFVERFAETVVPLGGRDDIEQVAMLARCSIGPFADATVAIRESASLTYRLHPGVLRTSPTSQ